MKNALSVLLSLLCVLPASAWSKDDGFTSDDEVLEGKSSDTKPKKAKKKVSSEPAKAGGKDAKGKDAEPEPGPVGVVLMPRDPGAIDTTNVLEAALTRAIENDGRLKTVDLLEALGGDPQAVKARPEVEDHFKKAKDAYDNLDLEAAAKEYLEGLKLMLEEPATASPPAVAHVLTQAGAAHLLNGDNAKAAGVFRRAAIICPSFAPDASEFSPDILAAYTEAKAKLSLGDKGTLTVTSNVSPARVFIDGTDRGVAPVTIKDLAAGGHHYVLLKSRGYKPWAMFIEAKASTTSTAAAEMRPLPEAERFRKAMDIAATELTAARPGFGAQEIASTLSARYVIFGTAQSGTSGAAFQIVSYDIGKNRRGIILKKNVLPGSPTFEADTTAMATQLIDSLVRPTTLVVPVVEEGPYVAVTDRGWFWPVIGVAAAIVVGGAVTGAVLGVEASQGHKSGLTITGIP